MNKPLIKIYIRKVIYTYPYQISKKPNWWPYFPNSKIIKEMTNLFCF